MPGTKSAASPTRAAPSCFRLRFPSKCPTRTSRRAERSRGSRRGYWMPRAAVFTGAGLLTAAFCYELYRRAGGRAGDAAAVPLPHPVDHRLRLDRARLAQCGAGLHPAVRRREADTIDLPPPGGAADGAHGAAVPRLPRGTRAHRRHGAGDRARACNRWAMPPRSTSSFFPTRATAPTSPPRRAPIEPCAAAARHHSCLLPPPPREPRTQGRQHQGLGAPLRGHLRELRHPRRRQRHVGHDARAPRARHGARSAAGLIQTVPRLTGGDDAAAVPHAVRLQRLRAAR